MPSEGRTSFFRQFFRFGVVGGAGFLVNMGVAAVLNLANGGTQNAGRTLVVVAGYSFSYSMLVWILAFMVANPFNFALNRLWTFRGQRESQPRLLSAMGRFFVIGAVAAAVGTLIKAAMTTPRSLFFLGHPFTEGGWLTSRELWAQAIAIVLTLPLNFLVSRVLVFNAGRQGP